MSKKIQTWMTGYTSTQQKGPKCKTRKKVFKMVKVRKAEMWGKITARIPSQTRSHIQITTLKPVNAVPISLSQQKKRRSCKEWRKSKQLYRNKKVGKS